MKRKIPVRQWMACAVIWGVAVFVIADGLTSGNGAQVPAGGIPSSKQISTDAAKSVATVNVVRAAPRDMH
jgi:hypothetical protein